MSVRSVNGCNRHLLDQPTNAISICYAIQQTCSYMLDQSTDVIGMLDQPINVICIYYPIQQM